MGRRHFIAAAAISLGIHTAALAVLGARWNTTDLTLPVFRPLSVRFAKSPAFGALPASVSPDHESPLPKETESPLPEPEKPPPAVDPEESIPAATPSPEPLSSSPKTPAGAPDISQSTDTAGGEIVAPSGAAWIPEPTIPRETEPIPVETIAPRYPVAARRTGLEGIVVIVVSVTPEGRPSGYRVLGPEPHRILVKAAVDAVMNTRYTAGTIDGRPVADDLQVKIVFDLDED